MITLRQKRIPTQLPKIEGQERQSVVSYVKKG